MQSKAFAKGQKTLSTCIFWLIDLNTPYVSLKAALLVDIPSLTLYCSVTSMLLVCGWWLNLLCRVFSNTLEKTGR